MRRTVSFGLAAVAGLMAVAVAAQTGPELTIEGTASSVERSAFTALIDAARETLRSPEFAANLRALAPQYPRVFFHTLNVNFPIEAKYGSVGDLADIVAGRPPRYRYVRVPAVLVGDSLNRIAVAGWNGPPEQSGSLAIGRFHLGRWGLADPVERSCAVNTVAHEMSHLVSGSTTIFLSTLTDNRAASATAVDAEGRDVAPAVPVGSYLVGSVAQCTWLQKQGRLASSDVPTCVAVFGVRGFNQARCDQFPGTVPISFRHGLPLPHILQD